MGDLFFEIMKLSITGSYVFLFVFIIRQLIKKAPRVFSYYLWMIFWVRLIVPKSFSSVLSVFNYTALTPAKSASSFENIVYPELIQITNDTNIVNNAIEVQSNAAQMASGTNPMGIVLWSAWIAGIVFILIYSLWTYISLKRSVSNSYWCKDNMYISKNVDSPFVIGLFRPKIYMPEGLGEEEFEYILCHEQVHIKRHDHIIKIVCYSILALHWFNPLAWIAFILMSKDIEISCDEKVLKQLGTGIKKNYSYSLLNMSLKEELTPVPLAFGQSSAKERIKRVMNYKKTRPIIIVLIIIILAASGCALLSNPVSENNDTAPAEATDVPEASVPVNTPVVVSEVKSDYDGLSGVELYNAVMVGAYQGKMMYTTEASNDFADIVMTTYKNDGNVREHFTETGEEPYITIYDADENKAYTYIEGSQTGTCYVYSDGYTYRYQPPLEEEFYDSLVVSKIIDFNGRETYYYEMHSEYVAEDNSYKETYVNKYWVDTETKVQMKGEFYMNDFLAANSAVTLLTDEFEITDNMFLPPADIEFTYVEE